MLTRRTFLTTIAAAPLAKFCKAEPVRQYANVLSRPPDGYLNCGVPYWWVKSPTHRVMKKADVEIRYGLPQGTLG